MTLFTSPCSSRRRTEYPIGTASNKLSLCRRTHLETSFELSINIHHSFELKTESPNSFNKPGILWKNTKQVSLRKCCRNVLYLVRKYDIFTPRSIFSHLILMLGFLKVFYRLKSRAKSLSSC